jgi:hypothetical protein
MWLGGSAGTMIVMSPEELASVCESWTELQHRRPEIVTSLGEMYGAVMSEAVAADRARWLVDAVSELVTLLTAPSQLGDRARELAQCLPGAETAPTFVLDGSAWMIAARDACSTWTDASEHAWRQAWLLLSDVLANESLSPFAGPGIAGF